jgi:hypothetical protein
MSDTMDSFLTPNPGAQMMDAACRAVQGMLLAGYFAAQKPGSTAEDVVTELRAQYARAKKDLRRQGHSLFEIPMETVDEFHDRILSDPAALADYEKLCAEVWATDSQSDPASMKGD